MDQLSLVLKALTALTLIAEKACEFILQGLKLVGVKEIKPEAKAMAVVVFTAFFCVLLNLDALPLAGVVFKYPFPWIGPLFTGILVGAGADILHVGKERFLKPSVQA